MNVWCKFVNKYDISSFRYLRKKHFVILCSYVNMSARWCRLLYCKGYKFCHLWKTRSSMLTEQGIKMCSLTLLFNCLSCYSLLLIYSGFLCVLECVYVNRKNRITTPFFALLWTLPEQTLRFDGFSGFAGLHFWIGICDLKNYSENKNEYNTTNKRKMHNQIYLTYTHTYMCTYNMLFQNDPQVSECCCRLL